MDDLLTNDINPISSIDKVPFPQICRNLKRSLWISLPWEEINKKRLWKKGKERDCSWRETDHSIWRSLLEDPVIITSLAKLSFLFLYSCYSLSLFLLMIFFYPILRMITSLVKIMTLCRSWHHYQPTFGNSRRMKTHSLAHHDGRNGNGESVVLV